MPAPTATPASTGPRRTPRVLPAEQAHLDHARDQLRRMRETTDRLDAAKATDAWTSELLGRVLARRVASLQDDPRTTLFFGRIDTRTEHGEETFHIGRRHVSRRPRATRSSSTGAPPSPPPSTGPPPPSRWASSCVAGSASTADGSPPTRTSTCAAAATAPTHSAHPRRRDRAAPHPARCATSSRRSSPSRTRSCAATSARASACRARPGTGKTAVGLHRAAWLLYSFRAQLDRSGVLVVGPNRAFLDHIGAVLPSLGEVRVGHATIDTLLDARPGARRGPHRRRHPQGRRTAGRGAAPGRLGARRPRRRRLSSCPRGVAHAGGCPRTRSATTLDALVARGVRYSAARSLLPQRLAHHVLLQMERSGDAPDDRVQDTVARSAPVTAYVRGLWPALDPAAVLFRLFSRRRDAHRRRGRHPHRRRAADAAVGQARRARRAPPAGRRADMALLDEAGRPARPHAEPRARGARRGAGPLPDAAARRRSSRARPGRSPCSATSPRARRRGPPRRGTTRWATSAARRTSSSCSTAASACRPWSSSSPHACCRTWRPGSGRRRRCATTPVGSPSCPTDADGRDAAVVRCGARGARRPGSVGVIVPDAGDRRDLARPSPPPASPHGRLDADHGDDEDRQVELVPASIAKGLEFDRVVVVEPAADRGRRARRAHRAAAALRRADPRGLGADRRARRAAAAARCAPDRLGRLSRRPRAGAGIGRGGQPAHEHVDEVRHLGRVDLHRPDAGVAAPDRQHDEAVLRVPRDAQRPAPPRASTTTSPRIGSGDTSAMTHHHLQVRAAPERRSGALGDDDPDVPVGTSRGWGYTAIHCRQAHRLQPHLRDPALGPETGLVDSTLLVVETPLRRQRASSRTSPLENLSRQIEEHYAGADQLAPNSRTYSTSRRAVLTTRRGDAIEVTKDDITLRRRIADRTLARLDQRNR